MTKYLIKKMVISSVTTTMLIFNNASAGSVAKPVDTDYLKLLDSFKNYKETSDLEKVSSIDSTFYTSDAKTMAELQQRADETMKAYLKDNNVIQSSAAQVLIKSLNDAYNVTKKKLEMQKAAADAFGQASKEATKLATVEKTQEKQCLNGFSNALAAGSVVNNDCNNQKSDDDKKTCSDELNACTAKINSDLEKFNSYLKKRDKLQSSKDGYIDVAADADYITANLPGSAQVCSHYSVTMANAENAGKCSAKLANDEKNESYQNPPPKTPDLEIHEDLDSYMLIPKHRALGWAIYKKMADDKVATTTEELKKIKDYIEKLGGTILNLPGGVATGDVALPWTDKEIKDFLATNPSKEDIQKKIVGLNDSQLDRLYHLEGMSTENITKLDLATTANGVPGGMWVNDKHYSKKEIKDFYAKGGDDYKVIVKEAGVTDLSLAREMILKARLINGIDPADGDKRLHSYFDQYSNAHPDGAFANDYNGWLNEVSFDGRTGPAMRGGTFTGDPTEWTGKDYYDRWVAGQAIEVPPYQPYKVPDFIWVNGQKLTKDKIQSFYANGGNDYQFGKEAGLSPDEARQIIPVARLINGLNPTDYETNSKYYFDQYSKANPTGVYANNYASWTNDQNPHVILSMKSGTFTGDPQDKSPMDYCIAAKMCLDPRSAAKSAAISAKQKTEKVANPKLIQAALVKTRDSHIKLISSNPKAQVILKNAVTEVEKTLRKKESNDSEKNDNLKKIYLDLNIQLNGLVKK